MGGAVRPANWPLFNAEPPVRGKAGAPPMPLGLLGALVSEAGVSEVMVCGRTVSVERNGVLEMTPLCFPSEESVLDLAFQIATAGGRELSMAQPYQTVSLETYRAALTIPPYSSSPTVTIRVHRSELEDDRYFLDTGSFSPQMREWLLTLSSGRRSFVVAGSAGSGKTTLLRWLVSKMPADERIVLVEEVRELRLGRVHPLTIELETRPANKEGRYAITPRDAARHALHLRPDRMALGEIRGPEALEWLIALTSGHLGSFATLHAPSARGVFSRLGWLAHLASPAVAPERFEETFIRELPVVLFMKRENGRRTLAEVLDGGRPVIFPPV